jgi:hypothetical protein
LTARAGFSDHDNRSVAFRTTFILELR